MIGRLRVLTWNLFHGRDFPPDPALRTLRSRLTGRPERNRTHLQLNRELLDEFASVLAAADWDLALLQECPPRWAALLAAACGASAHRVLTARNWLLPVTSALAARNPDLIASWEGGSNLTLVRGEPIVERRSLVLRRLPERRTMTYTGLGNGVRVANLHASGRPALAEAEVRLAAERAVAWSGEAPLVLGGDFNLRPSRTRLFDELAERYGLRRATAPEAIDHVLARGLEIVAEPGAWPPELREVEVEGLAVRLSDHAPVAARFRGSTTAASRGPAMVR
jgi:endonuclease/exonuclease/phosphatase family metal-dependent hydrolase